MRIRITILSYLCVSFWNFVRDSRRFSNIPSSMFMFFVWISRMCTFIFYIKTLHISKCSKCPTNVHSPFNGFALDSETKETPKPKQSIDREQDSGPKESPKYNRTKWLSCDNTFPPNLSGLHKNQEIAPPPPLPSSKNQSSNSNPNLSWN